jgi:hypothetical protein
MRHVNRYLSLYAYDLTLLEEMADPNYFPKSNLSGTISTHHYDYLGAMVRKKLMIETYVRYVEKARYVIGDEAYEILMRDFFDHQKWYEDTYTTSSYYRKKQEAEKQFNDYMSKFCVCCKSVEF